MTFCLLSENYIIIRNETVKIKQMQGKYETTAIDAYIRQLYMYLFPIILLYYSIAFMSTYILSLY